MFKVPARDNLPETIVIVVLNCDATGRKYYIKDDTFENKYLNFIFPGALFKALFIRQTAHHSLKFQSF